MATHSRLIISEIEGARELQKIRLALNGSDRNYGPTEIDQLPIMPSLEADGDLGAEMGVPAAATDGIRRARNAIILSLRLAIEIGHQGIHYSRNRNTYTRLRHYIPDYWTYHNVRAAVESLLAQSDLVREFRARPQNPYSPTFNGRRSVLFAGPAFVNSVMITNNSIVEVAAQRPRIILRDRRKKSLVIPPGPIVEETLRFLALFDDAVAGLHFGFSDPTIRWQSSTTAIAIDEGWTTLINTQRRFLARIFTGNMVNGGRFYRVFWQDLSKAIRRSLLINGAPTAEHDYSACHLRLAYFAIGERLTTSGAAGQDLYTLDGMGSEWRAVIKRAVSILLNARSYAGAVGALASVDEMPNCQWRERVEIAVAVVAGVMKRHEALAPLWHSGCGLGLQYIDSQLTIACATELIARGIVPLPIHDSMLVRAEHLADLKEVMERRFEDDGPRLAAERFKAIAKRRARGFRGHDLTQGRSAASVMRALSARAGPPSSDSLVPAVVSPSSRAAPRATSPATSVDGIPPDLVPLLAHPIFKDFERVIAHRRWVPGGLVRGALLLAASFYPSRSAAAGAVRVWITQMVSLTAATFDEGRLTVEVEQFVRRKPRPISAPSVARLCGISSTLAVELGLAVLVPSQRKQSRSKRAKRMTATLPRIINIKAAAPWGQPERRASWYKAYPDPIERQTIALRAILASGDIDKAATARASIERARRERKTVSSKQNLPVDDLLAGLTLVLMIHDFRSSSAPWKASDRAINAEDVEVQQGDAKILVGCKASSLADTDLRKSVDRWQCISVSMLSAITDRQVRILTL